MMFIRSHPTHVTYKLKNNMCVFMMLLKVDAVQTEREKKFFVWRDLFHSSNQLDGECMAFKLLCVFLMNLKSFGIILG